MSTESADARSNRIDISETVHWRREEALRDRAMMAFQDGAAKLRQVAEKLAPLAAGDPEVQDEVSDLRDLAEKFDAAEVSGADAKYMHQRAYGSGQSKRALMERLAADRAREREERRKDN